MILLELVCALVCEPRRGTSALAGLEVDMPKTYLPSLLGSAQGDPESFPHLTSWPVGLFLCGMFVKGPRGQLASL